VIEGFENRVLRKIFGSNKDEVTGGWRRLHDKELHNEFSSPDIIRVMKSRMRWVERVVKKSVHLAHTIYFCVSYDSYSKQQLFV
jgi:hypothetical protein